MQRRFERLKVKRPPARRVPATVEAYLAAIEADAKNLRQIVSTLEQDDDAEIWEQIDFDDLIDGIEYANRLVLAAIDLQKRIAGCGMLARRAA